MSPRRGVKQLNKRKHMFALELKDTVLSPKANYRQQQVAWFEGDDGDDIEFAYTESDLKLYKQYPALYHERRKVQRYRDLSFPFLQLPAEVRVLIYQQCLKCHGPIDLKNYNKLRVAEGNEVAGNLLRTCKLINKEGGQVLFSDNQFRFWNEHEIFLVLKHIPARHFQWLQELTVSIPFLGVETHDWKFSDQGDRIYHQEPQKVMLRSTGSSSQPNLIKFPVDTILRDLLSTIAISPRLKKLNLVIPPHWITHNLARAWHPYNTNPQWQRLAELFHHRADLEVFVTNLTYDSPQQDYKLIRKRWMKKSGRQLGVWDQREGVFDHLTDKWISSGLNTEEHPDNFLLDISSLFVENA
jgi:hypothetical protein